TNITATGSSTGATRETGEPWPYGVNNGGRSVWYRWTAPVTGVTRVSTAGSAFRTLLGIYTGNAVDALSYVATNDSAVASGVNFTANNGTTYQIQIQGRGNFGSASGNYTLSLNVLSVL